MFSQARVEGVGAAKRGGLVFPGIVFLSVKLFSLFLLAASKICRPDFTVRGIQPIPYSVR